ncbi:MAG TPA: hypothetical protein VF172_08230 [Nitrososphaera sp.]|jgi:hypothetical protein
MVVNVKDICREILSVDKSIRFAGIANMMGKVVAQEFRKGVTPLLSFEEVESDTVKSVLRMRTREDHEDKLGRAIYTFTLYEKIKRASIPLEHRDYALLMVSFDREADHENIILKKILPVIQENGLVKKHQ